MTTKITLRHTLPVGEETFWTKLFFDREYNRRLYLEGLGFKDYELIELSELPDGARVRRMRSEPASEAPAIVKKLAGTMSYVEEGRYDPTTKVYSFALTPSKLSDKVTISGTVRVVTKGPGEVERVVDVEMGAKIFGVGGALESFIEKTNRESWDKNAVFSRAFIAEKGLAGA